MHKKYLFALPFLLVLAACGKKVDPPQPSYDDRIPQAQQDLTAAERQEQADHAQTEAKRNALRGLIDARCKKQAESDRSLGLPVTDCDKVVDAYFQRAGS